MFLFSMEYRQIIMIAPGISDNEHEQQNRVDAQRGLNILLKSRN